MYFSLLFVLTCTFVFSLVPPQKDVDAFLNPTTHFWNTDLFDKDHIDYYLNGQLIASGKNFHEHIKSQLLHFPKYQNTYLQYQSNGDTLTIYRKASTLSVHGCITTFHALDVMKFNENGKCVYLECITDKSLDQIMSEIHCDPIFTEDEIKAFVSVSTCHEQPRMEWGSPLLEQIFSENAEIWGENIKVIGKKEIIDFSTSLPYKYLSISCDDVFVVGNTAYVPRLIHISTTDGSLINYRDVVKVTFNYPDGKVSRWEIITSDGFGDFKEGKVDL